MPFGLNVAGDAFQQKLDQVYSNLNGVTRIADDMFIYGTSDDYHDRNLTNFLTRTREHGLKIGLEKIQYKKTSVEFYGSQFTTQGHKPTDKKIQDIQLMPKPKDIKQLQSFLGMIKYLNRYSPRLAEITSPLHDLTKDNVPFIWGPEHTNLFHAAKQEIAKAPLMAYYDPKKPIVVQTDTSVYGIGCAMLQSSKPVAYASKALQAHEQGYVALEGEALAVAWALEKHHHFLYGQCFTLETDQKCLETILNRSIVESSPRLQCIITKCLPCDFKVKYIKGKDNVLADCMSRLPAGSDILSTSQINLPKISVNCITANVRASDLQTQCIIEATSKDDTLTLLKHTVNNGWPKSIKDVTQEIQPFWNFREQITIEKGLLLKNTRIIIPNSLQPELVEWIHEGHLGLEKCLARARSTVYWPNMQKNLTDKLQSCPSCLKYARANPKRRPDKTLPLGPEIPLHPWLKLASDIFHFNGTDYLLVVDYISCFPVIRRLSSQTSKAVIEQLKSIFAEYGVPDTLITDNGPCYDSKEFKSFT